MLENSFSARRTAEICGFRSVAMLDYLQRSGVYVPQRRSTKRRGKGRRYEFRDLMVLKTIAALLNNGASVSALSKALQEFQRLKWKADHASLQDEDGGVLRYLLASKDGVFFARSADNLYDLTRHGQMAFSFVIDLDSVHTELCTAIAQGKLGL